LFSPVPMKFALSTHWNAGRHATGEAMLDEIAGLGLTEVELGYDTRIDLVPGIQERVRSGAMRVCSLHNICPVPVGAVRGHPEIFLLGSLDERERASAVHHTARTLRFAAELGARVVVTHAGNVEMDHFSRQLADLHAAGRQYDDLYEKLKLRCQTQRDKRAPRQLKLLRESLDQLKPVLAETGVVLALENLPTWEALPTELEMEELLRDYASAGVRYWHDIGHGQIRQLLGFINAERWLERLLPWLAGMHVHDVAPPATDHVMPPRGCVDFARLRRFAEAAPMRVIEPTTVTPIEDLRQGLAHLRQVWGESETTPASAEETS
jgi:sugar phosphate isomerase/epimerase